MYDLSEKTRFTDFSCGIGGFAATPKDMCKGAEIVAKYVYSYDADTFSQASYVVNCNGRSYEDFTQVNEKDIFINNTTARNSQLS